MCDKIDGSCPRPIITTEVALPPSPPAKIAQVDAPIARPVDYRDDTPPPVALDGPSGATVGLPPKSPAAAAPAWLDALVPASERDAVAAKWRGLSPDGRGRLEAALRDAKPKARATVVKVLLSEPGGARSPAQGSFAAVAKLIGSSGFRDASVETQLAVLAGVSGRSVAAVQAIALMLPSFPPGQAGNRLAKDLLLGKARLTDQQLVAVGKGTDAACLAPLFGAASGAVSADLAKVSARHAAKVFLFAVAHRGSPDLVRDVLRVAFTAAEKADDDGPWFFLARLNLDDQRTADAFIATMRALAALPGDDAREAMLALPAETEVFVRFAAESGEKDLSARVYYARHGRTETSRAVIAALPAGLDKDTRAAILSCDPATALEILSIPTIATAGRVGRAEIISLRDLDSAQRRAIAVLDAPAGQLRDLLALPKAVIVELAKLPEAERGRAFYRTRELQKHIDLITPLAKERELLLRRAATDPAWAEACGLFIARLDVHLPKDKSMAARWLTLAAMAKDPADFKKLKELMDLDRHGDLGSIAAELAEKLGFAAMAAVLPPGATTPKPLIDAFLAKAALPPELAASYRKLLEHPRLGRDNVASLLIAVHHLSTAPKNKRLAEVVYTHLENLGQNAFFDPDDARALLLATSGILQALPKARTTPVAPGLPSQKQLLELGLVGLSTNPVKGERFSGTQAGAANFAGIELDPRRGNLAAAVHEVVHVALGHHLRTGQAAQNFEDEYTAYYTDFIAENGRLPKASELQDAFDVLLAPDGKYAAKYKAHLEAGDEAGMAIMRFVNRFLRTPVKHPRELLGAKLDLKPQIAEIPEQLKKLDLAVFSKKP